MPAMTCKCGTILVIAKADYAKMAGKEFVCSGCQPKAKQGLVGKVTRVAGPDAEVFKEPDGAQEVRKYKKKWERA